VLRGSNHGYSGALAFIRFMEGVKSWTSNQERVDWDTFTHESLDFLNFEDAKSVHSLISGLPGIASKTKNFILAFVFNWFGFPVDRHVEKIVKRVTTGLLASKTWSNSPKDEFVALIKTLRLPFPQVVGLHRILQGLGMYICTSKNPKCGVCPLVGVCKFGQKVSSGAMGDMEDLVS